VQIHHNLKLTAQQTMNFSDLLFFHKCVADIVYLYINWRYFRDVPVSFLWPKNIKFTQSQWSLWSMSAVPHTPTRCFHYGPDLASSATVLVHNSTPGTAYIFAWCEKPPLPSLPFSILPFTTTKSISFSTSSYYRLM